MKKHLQKNISIPDLALEPSAGLANTVMVRIERYEQRLVSIKRACFGMCAAASIALTGFAFMDAVTELSRSGFFSFVSLIFSDFSSAFVNLPDFFFSVMESIPAIPIALLFGGIAFFLWSVLCLSIKTRTCRFSVSR